MPVRRPIPWEHAKTVPFLASVSPLWYLSFGPFLRRQTSSMGDGLFLETTVIFLLVSIVPFCVGGACCAVVPFFGWCRWCFLCGGAFGVDGAFS